MQLFLISVAIVAVSALLVRRLLGIKNGRWGATVTSAVLGQAATIGILQFVTGDALALGLEWYPLGIALAITLTMLVFTVIELISRPAGHPRSLRIPHPIQALRRRLQRSTRYAQVSSIAVRSGLLNSFGDSPADQGSKLGRALATTFEQSGGLFVKLGQAMASQPQLVTPTVAAELTRLQDQAAAADPAAALAVLHEELGPVDDVFSEFAPEPIATASIAQTYLATLRDGRDVVVKVQRPGIRESMERDIEILARLADRLEKRTAWAKTLGIRELTAGFADATREELDFHIESANCVEARRNLQDSDPIAIPEVMTEYTTERVLVQERIPGKSVSTVGIFEGISDERRKVLADGLLKVIVRDMIGGGRFHADPHAGNVFLQPDGRLALIDFGAVGRLNRYERIGLVDMFRGLQTEDPALIRQAAVRLGTPNGRIDTDALDRELAQLLSGAIMPGDRLNPAAIGEIVFVFRDFGISLPRSITALFRTLFTILGTLDVVSPGYDLIGAIGRLGGAVAGPFGQHKNLRELVESEVMSLAPIFSRLPGDIDDVARALVRGEVRTRVSLLSEPEDVHVLWRMVNRMLMVVVGCAVILASALLLTTTGAGQMGTVVHFVGGIGFAFATILLLRTVVQMLRDRA